MLKVLLLTAACLLMTASVEALAAGDTGEAAFRDLYKELVETNTTLSSGSCTLAAERMAAHLKAAGFPDSDLHPFAAPDHPQEGGLVAVYPGRDGFAAWLRTTWLPYTQRVPEDVREEFIAGVTDRYLAKHPPDAESRVHVKMVRLEIAAVKV